MLLNGSNFARNLSLLFVLAVLCDLCGSRCWALVGRIPQPCSFGTRWFLARASLEAGHARAAPGAGLGTSSGFTFLP